MATLAELEKTIRDRGFIGVNLHVHENGEWSCWTRPRDGGWSRSGTHPTLEAAVTETFSLVEDDEEDDWEDLI